MFIKNLKISTKTETVRDMFFEGGMNLIVDNTPTSNQKLTGNNVGKTTVLKLIYFCLGGEGKEIYTDEEDGKLIYEDVKNYLIDNEVLITLTLVDSIEPNKSNPVVIERNFLTGKKGIIRINGKSVKKQDMQDELKSVIFPGVDIEKPSFKQIISHNFRYKDDSINKTLKTLTPYTTDVEYETLYLYLLGCSFDDGAKKQSISSKISQEQNYKDRLEKKQTKTSYEVALSLIENDISNLKEKKSLLNLNENFEQDLEHLNMIKYQINKQSSIVTKLKIRRDIIVEAQEEMEKDISYIDFQQLEILYAESKKYLSKLHRTFEQLVDYHNKMIREKVKFITQELPSLESRICEENKAIKKLLEQEKELSEKILKSDSFHDLENLISELNEKYRLKGEYENIISQIKETEDTIKKLEIELRDIDQILYSEEFESKLKEQLSKFNKYFSEISNELYGEKYALKFDKVIHKKTQKLVYKFSAFNLNMSSGKKQGEILCFDLAYSKFADSQNIPSLHFLLNDKKELMHDNQLLQVSDFVSENNIQLIISILRDKLPAGLLEKSNIVVELSPNEKLFRIE